MAPDFGWFDEARFGLFVHWGPISRRGLELSWPLVGGAGDVLPYARPEPVSEYYSGFESFCPEPGAAREWCRLARAAGMGYAILTTKHHDGFAMWPTELTDFSIKKTAYRGDLVGEFVEAARAEGLRVGLYHSLSDWHHPDYPAFRNEDQPYVRYLGRRSEPEAWDRYVGVLHGQVRELLSNYGPIDLLWFDGGWERHRDEWRVTELDALIRELQPSIVVNDRLPGAGDYATPEQAVPADPPEGRWETCLTMNRTWGFCPADTEYKPARQLIHTLCETAGKGGNLLLNVGPDGDGRVPPAQVERLEAMATWMERHAEAIRDTTAGVAPWQWYGPSTRKAGIRKAGARKAGTTGSREGEREGEGEGDTVYLHLTLRPYDTVSLRGVPVRRITGIRNIATGTELDWTPVLSAQAHMTSDLDAAGEALIRVPEAELDWAATVLAVEFSP